MDNMNSKPQESVLKRSKRGFFKVIMGRSTFIALFILLDIGLLIAGFRWLDRHLDLWFSSSVLLTAGMLIYLLNTDSNPAVKLTWCVFIAVSPLFGVLLYFYIKLDLGHRTERYLVESAIAATEPLRLRDPAPLDALKKECAGDFNLATYLSRCGFDAYANTSVRYFPLGEDKFEALKEALRGAEHFIFMEYFIVGEGRMWDEILTLLVQKAREGVEVRFMYDGTCAFTRLPYGYPKKLQALGIQCKMFAPFQPFVTTVYNNRDHRKIAVIDGKIAFTGGINLADEYINAYSRLGHWKDTAIELRGEAVRSFTLMFLQMWCASERSRDFEPYLLPPEECRVEAEGFVIPYGDSPMDRELVGEMVYLDMINRAEKNFYIMTPYLILDNETLTALRFAARRGVDVRILLPHIPDKKYAFALAKTHYKALLTAGVRIFEYTPGFVHAKVAESDGRTAVVGTINLDYRSLYHHFECAAWLCRVPAVADIRRDFLETQEKSQEVTLEDVAREKLSTKAMGAVLKLVAPLL